jgi:hypothetical protein
MSSQNSPETDSLKERSQSASRLKRFAEIYRTKMAARPFMEIIARYQSMTEAGLTVREREMADLYLDTHRFNDLLYPVEIANVAKKD